MKKLGLLFAFLFLITGCAEGNNRSIEEVVVENQGVKTPFKGFYTMEIRDFSPNKVYNFEQKAIMRNLHEGLYKIEDSGQLVLGVAEEISINEDDGYLVYDVKLRDGVKFHNGEDLKPEDIQYSIFKFTGLLKDIREQDLEYYKYFVNLFDGNVDNGFKKGRVEIHGEDRIVIFVDDFYGERITSSLLAETYIVPEEYGLENQIENPVGLGPFKFTSIDENGTIHFSRFEQYYGKKPQIEKIELAKISSKEERNQAFENKELDILDSYPGRDKEEGYKPLSGDVYSLVFNTQNETYKSRDLRKALGASINKNLIQQQLFGASGGVVETPLSPLLNSFIPEIEVYKSFMPEVSRDFVENNPSFSELPLNIAYIEEDNLSKAIGEYIVGNMNEAGFNVRLNPLSWPSFEKNVIRERNYEMAIMRYPGNIDPYKIMDRFTTKNISNVSDYYNFDYNALMRDDRDNYTAMINMVKSETPEMFLLDPGESYIMSDRFTLPKIYPYPYLDFSSINFK